MAKDHGSSVKNDKQYEGLRKKGMSKSRAGRNLEQRGLVQPGREELGQQPEPEEQRQWEWRQHGPEKGGRPQGRQEVQRPRRLC